MDIVLLTTAAFTLLKPFLTKAGGKIAEAVGEDFYKKVKGLFSRKEDNQLLEKAEKGPLSGDEVRQIESSVGQELPKNDALLKQLKEQLNLGFADTTKLEGILTSIEKIKMKLQPLYAEYADAGVATQGDYLNTIRMQERKLAQMEDDLYTLVHKKS
jgi:hypothetical protein